MKVKDSKISTPIWIVTIVLVIGVFGVLGWLFLGPGAHTQAGLTAQTAPSQVGSQPGVNTGGSSSNLATNQLPDCGSPASGPVAQLQTFYYNPNNNNQYTQVATSVQVCTANTPTCSGTVSTSTVNVTTTTGGQLTCGQTVKEIAGDGGTTYFYADTTPFQIVSSPVPLANNGAGIQVIPSGAASLSIGSSGTVFNNPSSTITYNWTTADGSGAGPDQNIYLQVQGPTPPSQFGDLGLGICLRYQAANWTKVQVSGAQAVSISHILPAATNNVVSCYQVPTLPSSTTSGPRYVQYTLNLQAISTGPTNGTTMDVILTPKTNQIYNSYLVPQETAQALAAMAAGNLTNANNACIYANGFDNCNNPTSAASGLADVTKNAAITFTR